MKSSTMEPLTPAKAISANVNSTLIATPTTSKNRVFVRRLSLFLINLDSK